MRSRRVAAAAVTVLAATGVLPAATAAAQTSDLWVDRSSANCADSGPGSEAAPFCTVSAAARTAGPGQTVHIARGAYGEDVVLTRSGTADKPISFVGTNAFGGLPGLTNVTSLTVRGASHLNVSELGVLGQALPAGRSPVTVTDSTGIGLTRLRIGAPMWVGSAAVHVSGGSAVTLARSTANSAVLVDRGASGTVLAGNDVRSAELGGILAEGAPGTTVVSNAIRSFCAPRIQLAGGSTGGTVANNFVIGYGAQVPDLPCPADGMIAVDVTADSVSGTTVKYNSVQSVDTPYRWAGTPYRSADAFRAGTGQGERDYTHVDYSKVAQSTVDSADATVPGMPQVDLNGYPRVDSPSVPNTGTGPGWYDRGAVEDTNPIIADAWNVSYKHPQRARYDVVFDLGFTSPWFPSTAVFDFGDGSPQVPVAADRTEVTHTYPGFGDYTATLTVTDSSGKKVYSSVTVTVADRPLAAELATAPAAGADTLTVRAEASGLDSQYPVASYRYDFGDGTPAVTTPAATHRYAAPGSYPVELTVTDDHGRVLKKSTRVTVGPAYVPLAQPVRTLDTRTGTGAPKGKIGPGGSLKLKVTGTAGVPADGTVTAVLVNLTSTGSTEDSHVIAYGGGARPNTSNLNTVAGRDVGNTAMVPVAADGTVTLYNHSGRTDLIADVQGYYGLKPQVRTDLHPVQAVRALDTRSGTGVRAGALGPNASLAFKVRGPGLLPDDAKVAVLNLTATGSSEDTYIAANPSFPVSISNLNVSRGATVANQVTVPIAADGTVKLYNHVGTVQLVADLQGYYGAADNPLVPVQPVRALDTRTTGKPVSRAHHTVVDVRKFGVPGNATAVLVNLTGLNARYEDWLAAGDPATTEWTTSNLNLVPGAIVSNLALVPVHDGLIEVVDHVGSADAIVDIQGYTAP
ncbi:PKD domain-containing protein [Kitasatospora cineracea]|uniref:PKD domain-containing protein n=1 Tax=Kitasatospora cineracea TaxID=88074 RepID=UPI0037FC8648